MNPEEYDNLAQVEKHHWYYSGKREIVRYWIQRVGGVSANALLVDCGAGTGAFAMEMQDTCKVIAIDDYPESLTILRERLGENLVRAGSCTDLPLETGTCDFVTALDVLEHIEDDEKAMGELFRVTKPGGVIILTVPALMSLWSDWDVTLRHFRRYNRAGLVNLVSKYSVEVIELNYMNFWAFPAIWLIRKMRGLSKVNEHRSEDQIPPGPINSLLRSLFVKASCQTIIRWPVGVGLLAVLRKK